MPGALVPLPEIDLDQEHVERAAVLFLERTLGHREVGRVGEAVDVEVARLVELPVVGAVGAGAADEGGRRSKRWYWWATSALGWPRP
jgi:hypothetical protein